MRFIKERVAKICEELTSLQTTKLFDITEFMKADNHFLSIEDANENGTFTPYNSDEYWGGKNYNCWFKTAFNIKNKITDDLILKIATNLDGWDAINPQFIVYINNELRQGVDINHSEVYLGYRNESDINVKIDLHAYTSMSDLLATFLCQLQASVHLLHANVRELTNNLELILASLDVLDDNDLLKIKGLEILNECINLLDLRKVREKEFFTSVDLANNYINKAFYNNSLFEHKSGVSIAAIGHTHIDIAWHWSVEQTRQKVARSFATALDLLGKYPDFKFMSSQPQLYAFIKEDQPEMYEKIKEYVKDGRWEVEGAMWLEADCNVTSGESLVRQILYGKKFIKEEFGLESKVLWLPDVFGYSAALPQILKKANVAYFMTTKINWNQINQLPYDTYYWKGIDGSKVLTHMITTPDKAQSLERFFTTYNGVIHPRSIKGAWDRYQQKHVSNEVLVAYGYGDGGGGVTASMIESAFRLKNGYSSIPKVKLKKVGDFFNDLANNTKDNPRLPTWTSELYMEGHRGTYTSMARNKRDNRRCELIYQEVEKLGSICEKYGSNYEQAMLEASWKVILLNQFHDILPGTSIKEVYDTTASEYANLLTSAENLKANYLKMLSEKINVNEDSIFVFNSLNTKLAQVLTFVYENKDNLAFYLEANGKKYGVQKIANSKYLFIADGLPSIGYKLFKIVYGFYNGVENLTITPTLLENKYFKILLNANGEFTSFYDKKAKREIIPPKQLFNQLVAYEDKPMHYDNWDIDVYYEEKAWLINNVVSIKVVEKGHLRSCLEIRRKFLDSTIIQKIYIYRDLAKIDVNYTIDWKQSQILLKALFPVDVNAVKATYDIQFGNVERATYRNTSWDEARFEVCAHKWVDLSEHNFGLSLLNDSKYGHDIHNNLMRITLLKSGIHPFEQADQEVHNFTYALYPHQKSFREAKVQEVANILNTPASTAFVSKNENKNKLGDAVSFYAIDTPNIMIDTIKKAEDGNGYIVRMYEYFNESVTSTLTTFEKIKSCCECDLLENNLIKIENDHKKVVLKFSPFEIKTIRIVFS